MDILFILLGVAIFFAAAAVFTIDHLEVNPAQAIVSFFIPPFAWWLYSHYWEKSRRIAYTQLVGSALILGGLLMSLVFQGRVQVLEHETKSLVSDAVKNYVGSDKALNDLASAERRSKWLNGRIAGKEFIFDKNRDSAEFDTTGTLRIKHGKGFHGHFEIAIGFGKLPHQSEQAWRETIRPDSVAAPFIYLSWLDSEGSLLRSRKFSQAYSMDFTLVHQEYNQFTGSLQLLLPDEENSFLVGDFPVYGSRLRFHGEGLIKDHDSMETLQVIATQTLSSTYKKYVEDVLGFQDTYFDYRTGTGQGKARVYVKDKKGYVRKVPLSYYKNENGWFLDVNGLKDALLDPGLIVSNVPSSLQPSMVLDQRNIGETKLLADVSQSELSALTVDEQETISQEENNAVSVQSTNPEKEKTQTQTSVQSRAPVQAEAPHLLIIEVKRQEEQIENLLSPLMNKDVELETQAGKFKDGVYVGVYRKQVVLETQVGGGVVESLTEYRDLKKLRVLNAPSARPQVVEFQYSVNP